MRLELHLPAIMEQMSEAKILRVMAQEGDQLSIGSPLLELEVNLSSLVAHDCPPVSYFRIVLREAAYLRRMAVAAGQTVPVGVLLAVLGQSAGIEPEGEAARRLRVNVAGILPQWDEIG